MATSNYSRGLFYVIFIALFLIISCEKDATLFSERVLENDDVSLLDDNFRIPSDRVSVLDVLSNDSYISSENTRIVDITAPSKGAVRINEDNTITYIPEKVIVDEPEVAIDTEEDSDKADSNDEVATESETSNDDTTQEANTEVTTTEETSVETSTTETSSETEEVDTPIESQATEQENPQVETTTETTVPENTGTVNQEESQPEPSADNNVQEATNEEENTSQNTPTEISENQQTTNMETTVEDVAQTADSASEDNRDTSEVDATDSATENPPSEPEQEQEQEQEQESNTSEEDASTETVTDSVETDSTVTEEIEEDSFTYTIETEDEDGSTTTETATVTVEVASETTIEEPPVSEPTKDNEVDYWRNPVIEGTRLLDEKFYDLDTGKIYSKEVNLQRGQVANYIDHENCPQRIKDKWADRIEISPDDVNGSQEGLQKIFDAHPRGTLFYLRAGVYQDQRNAVLENNQDVVGEYGAILDGSGIQGNSEDATRAIRSMERGYICNLKVREYPTWNDPQNPKNPRGAALEVIQNGAILNCDVHSQNRALALIYGSKAMWNKITAGRLGLYGYGSHETENPNRRGAIVKYNEVYNCNFNEYDGEHEAGGAKFVQVDGTLWSHNYIHDIPSGAGIWQDGDNRESEVYNNVIIKTHRGIFSELSHTSNIHHNTIEYGTGFGAIYMSNAQGEKAHHNFVRWCRNGITIRDKDRGNSRIYPGQPWRGMNNEINNNHIWQKPDTSTWTHGMATLFDGHIDPNNTSNRWHDNHYYLDDNAQGDVLLSEDNPNSKIFMYSKLAPDSDHKAISWEEWKRQSGDSDSTLEYQRFF